MRRGCCGTVTSSSHMANCSAKLNAAQARCLLAKFNSGDFTTHRWPTIKSLLDMGMLAEVGKQLRVTALGRQWCFANNREEQMPKTKNAQQRLTIVAMRAALERAGFIVGERDPRLNTDYEGKYMVVEAHDESELPTRNGENGPWCIVGNDLDALINDAYHNATPLMEEAHDEPSRLLHRARCGRTE